MTNEFETHPDLIKKRAQSMFATRLVIAVMIVVLLAVLSLLTANAIASFATRGALLDCTTAGGECYEEAQKNQEHVLTSLIEASVNAGDGRAEITRETSKAAAVCNNRYPAPINEDMFRKCIEKEMK